MIVNRGARVLSISIALLCASFALCVPGAGAEFAEVGQATPPDHICNSTEANATFAQTHVSGGNSYTIPSDGAILSWTLFAGATPLPNPKLKVVRPGPAAGQFTVIGEATAGEQHKSVFTTFATQIAVKAGDLLGFYPGSMGECLSKATASNTGLVAPGDAVLNTPVAAIAYSEVRLPVSVLLLPAPSVASISPSSGDITGKTAVTITGEDFVEVKSVSFGGVPAESFKTVSAKQVTAVSPPGVPGPVDVQVTTALAGQSRISAGDKFTYVAAAAAGPLGPTAIFSGSSFPGRSSPAFTGKRDAALKKCKKKARKAQKKCRKKAKKLPL